jgi:CRISPR-associated endonuclease Csn1
MTTSLGLDIGSNSVGSAWVDTGKKEIRLGDSVFPAGVEDSDDKRGKPRNAKRASTRRTRTTLARRAERKRMLRQCLTKAALLPMDGKDLQTLMDMNPWELRRKALTEPLSLHQFGRVLVHLNQHRGASGVHLGAEEDKSNKKSKMKSKKGGEEDKEGAVKEAIGRLRGEMVDRYATEGDDRDGLKASREKFAAWARQRLVTVGRFVADEMPDRRNEMKTKDKRSDRERDKGHPRIWCNPVRNREGRFKFHADRELIRQEFVMLWDRQASFRGPVAALLTPELKQKLLDPTESTDWRCQGLIFGQRRQTWDLGTLGRCVLEPSERCAPHADRFASYYRTVETVNNIRIIPSGQSPRPLTVDERKKILTLLRGPLGVHEKGKYAGEPKTTVNVTDIRLALGLGKPTRRSQIRLNIENDPDREINTDWFHREIAHGAIGEDSWNNWDESRRESVNRAILKFNPDDDEHASRLRDGAISWCGSTNEQAERLIAAWRKRPKLEDRVKLSRRAIRNVLAVMDAVPDHASFGFDNLHQWLTQIEARKLIAEDVDFRDVTTGRPLDEFAKHRYATGAKGLNKRDRHYLKKHLLKKDGETVFGPDGRPIAILPPAPMLTNPVVRKAIHEVRRHVIEYLRQFGRKPDYIRIELGREARMTKKDADRTLERIRRQERIRKNIVKQFDLGDRTRNQQNAAVERVVLAVQQNGICPLCGNTDVKDYLCPTRAAEGNGVEVAHIIPLGNGGPNGWSNKVLAHTKCNQNMLNMTPRDLWGDRFKEKMKRVEEIYKDRNLPKKEDAEGQAEWPLYFDRRDDHAKLDMFSKSVKDLEGFRESQLKDTRYAARQVMAYLADALFEGKGLPERRGPRLIFASTGIWTKRFRREWGLFFDPHGQRAKGLAPDEEKSRQEKNREDHREHALDALVTAMATEEIKDSWLRRAAEAERLKMDEDVYRREHPIAPPSPWKSVKELQEQAKREIFGDPDKPRPVAHRPAKRKIVGPLHKETLYGAVLDKNGVRSRDRCTKRQSVYATPDDCLKPSHLRVGRMETLLEAIKRITKELLAEGLGRKEAKTEAQRQVNSEGFKFKWTEPDPQKTGVVRDPELCRVLRRQLVQRGLDPDSFTPAQLKATIEAQGPLTQKSGVPIHSVVLLWSNKDPAVFSRWQTDPATGAKIKQYDALTDSGDRRAARIYDAQSNHHIEIRRDDKDQWSGKIIKTWKVAERNSDRLRAVRDFLKKNGVQVRRPRRGERSPPPGVPLRRLPKPERERIRKAVGQINSQYPLVDRTNDPVKGGDFVMSLSQGEMIFARPWDSKSKGPLGSPNYFVVVKLDPPNSIVLVPHWDGRRAKGRKDENGKKVPNSQRDDFTVTPGNLPRCGPADGEPPYKVRVGPLGDVVRLNND